MEDPQIHGTIEQLVAEEHELWERESDGNASEADRRREAGRDPEAADVRQAEVVERYQQ